MIYNIRNELSLFKQTINTLNFSENIINKKFFGNLKKIKEDYSEHSKNSDKHSKNSDKHSEDFKDSKDSEDSDKKSDKFTLQTNEKSLIIQNDSNQIKIIIQKDI